LSAEANATRQQQDRIALSPHAALKTRAEGDILVLPERAMRIGGSGGEILRLCLEPRTIDDILTELARRHPDVPDLGDSAGAFLDEMIELGGLVRCPEETS
jgi:pyrroloquinoline quinone biosynthesis protein D